MTGAQPSVTGSVDFSMWEADPPLGRAAWAAVCIDAASIFLFVADAGLMALSLPKIEAQYRG